MLHTNMKYVQKYTHTYSNALLSMYSMKHIYFQIFNNLNKKMYTNDSVEFVQLCKMKQMLKALDMSTAKLRNKI